MNLAISLVRIVPIQTFAQGKNITIKKMEGYIVKDEDGRIYFFRSKPYKRGNYWVSVYLADYEEIYADDLPSDIKPQWSDDEPIKVKLQFVKK